MSNILILTSSGRKESNTSAMAAAFAEGAEESGHEVETINTINLKVNPCRGCESCRDMGRCCFDDDFSLLRPQIEQADFVVLACPVYWYDFPAQTKLVIDKFVSFLWGDMPEKPKKMILLSCAQETDEPYVFAGIDAAFESTAAHIGWPVAAKIERGGIDLEGDVLKTNVLDECRQLGMSI